MSEDQAENENENDAAMSDVGISTISMDVQFVTSMDGKIHFAYRYPPAVEILRADKEVKGGYDMLTVRLTPIEQKALRKVLLTVASRVEFAESDEDIEGLEDVRRMHIWER